MNFNLCNLIENSNHNQKGPYKPLLGVSQGIHTPILNFQVPLRGLNLV